MGTTKAQLYERLSWWKKAMHDSLAVSRNHWDTAAKITSDKERRKLYREYATETNREMNFVLGYGYYAG